MLETFVRDLQWGVRILLRMRGAAVVAVLTLGLGIGATTTMFSVVYTMALRPPPFVRSDRLVALFNTVATPREGSTRLRWSMPNILDLQSSAHSFEAIASFTGPLLSISGRGDPEYVDAEVVSPEYFGVLRVPPVAGRVFRPEESTVAGVQPVTLISWRLLQRKFAGNLGCIGSTITVNSTPLTIIGILPEGFAGLSGKAELWIAPPMAARLSYGDYLTTPQNFISVVARLKDGVTLSQANAEMAAIGPRFRRTGSPADAVWSSIAIPLREARVDPVVRRSAFVLLGAAVCVLIIACVNVASLLLARARLRRREIAIRLAIGSGRRRLLQQLLTEGLVMALAAGVCGAIFAGWGVSVFARTAPVIVATSRNQYGAMANLATSTFDRDVLLFAAAIALGTTLLFALAPAIAASRLELVAGLKEDDRGGGRRGGAMSALVVMEVALACLLLTASGMLIETFAKIQNRRTGFVPDHVMTFWVRPSGTRYPVTAGPATVERLLANIQAAPGVISAAVNRCVPFSGCSRSSVTLADRPVDPEAAPGVGRHYISADYFRALGIPIIAGRGLTPADTVGRPPVAVVNQAGARRLWPGENPIGKRVWFGTTTGPFSRSEQPVEVVGVAGDVRYEGVDQPDQPDRADFYTSYLQFCYPDTMVIVKTSGPPAAILPAMRSAVAATDSTLPIYEAMTLDQRIDASVARPRFNATLLASFAAAALLLSAIGVYGMMSYSVSWRMRDLGVRLALGADSGRLTRLVLGNCLRLAVIGAGVGMLGSFALARVARAVMPDVATLDTRMVVIAACIIVAVATLAALGPARRAGTVDPMVVLRND